MRKKSRKISRKCSIYTPINPSIELLKELHILTRDGRINQDSRRKLKQVYHLCQFIAPLIEECPPEQALYLADHGAGKSYLGFILYDLYLKTRPQAQVYGIETRRELVEKSRELATQLGFERMVFANESVADATDNATLPERFDIVTALHACNTATDGDSICAEKTSAFYCACALLPSRSGGGVAAQ